MLNGSFVKNIIEPNDVDGVLLLATDAGESAAIMELQAGLPFLEIDFVDQEGFAALVDRFRATAREGAHKAMTEVLL